MIVYTTVSNPGGMQRVAESVLALQESLGKVDIVFFIFSKRPITITHPNIHWIEWDEYDNPYSKNNTEHFREIVKKNIPEKVDWIIGDYMTLAYFDFVKAPIIYDVHILGKPLYNAIKKYRGIHILDTITVHPVTALVDLQEFFFLKFENKFISQASRYILNSRNSGTYLKELYSGEVLDKPMTYIPVASDLNPLPVVGEKTMDVYFFGRFHPMKGFHLMFERDWKKHPLHIRGMEPVILDEKGRAYLQERSIFPLNWSWESETLVKELLSSRIVLFPSIYEPWGLALQEALSLGCICLANRNFSGHEEQIQDGINGFLVDMNQPSWFEKIEEILGLPEQRLKEISENARKGSERGFKTRTTEWVDYIKGLLSEKI